MPIESPPPPGEDLTVEQMLPLVYEELRLLARRRLRDERAGHTLDTNALVHEAYLRLAGREGVAWRDRPRFFALASRVMRNVLVDHARRRAAAKRGDGVGAATLHDDVAAVDPRTTDFLAVHDALQQLEAHDPRLVQVVECRFFAGCTAAETADALSMSLRTVERDWMRAKAYLHDILEDLPAS